MNKLKTMFNNYVAEEDAAEDIKTIIFVVLAIVVVIAIGWYVWNLISEWSKRGTQASDNANKAQSDPFGSGTGPFGN